ncbi:hypothetical protein CEXT_305421 [Caerostris extrusa]|uniref:Uncharacterized protein n=1 Tax=Caerostris extrusa TaxID=172846 RepID=A0AAV4P7C5_CAEEX|nr:hypothetical protein CEXT_305421 [Caerostris extrusa]
MHEIEETIHLLTENKTRCIKSEKNFHTQSNADGLWHPRRPLFYGLAQAMAPVNIPRVSVSPAKGEKRQNEVHKKRKAFPHQSHPDGLWHPRRPLFYGVARSWLPLNLPRVSVTVHLNEWFSIHPVCRDVSERFRASLHLLPLFMNANGFGKCGVFFRDLGKKKKYVDGGIL